MKKLKYIFIVLFFIAISYFSGLIGYSLYKPINEEEPNLNTQKALIGLDELNMNKEKEVGKVQVAKVTPSTKITYEYYYKSDNITETYEDVPPYFLIDLTREEMEKKFDDWNIKSFSEKEVVMQKVMDGESIQHYVVGEYDGYVAIFYEKEINGTKLKEITSMPISALSLEEQEKIKNGIKIVGEDELISFLENYES